MVFKFLKDRLPTGGRSLHVSRFFNVSLEDYQATGERDAILASSGMGKSYLTGVIAEETLENGGLLCIIDPEGEYFTMAERYPMLIVGGENAMVPLEEEAIDLYIKAMLETNLSLVFDLSDFLDHEQQDFYAQIAESLFFQETAIRKKVRIIVEEAQIFAPQRLASAPGGKNKKKYDPVNSSQKLAKRGRKRAIDSLWATQRPASLSKDILSQCNRFWFGGITAEQDYKAIKSFLNEAGISFNNVKELQPGEFYFYSKGATKLIKVRKRHCKHAGATPEAQQTFQAVTDIGLQRAVEALVDQIAIRSEEKRQEQSEINKLKTRVRELENDNAALRDELGQEKLATKVIKRIEIHEPGIPKPIPRKRPSAVAANPRPEARMAPVDEDEF
jgi:hypothetical protein